MYVHLYIYIYMCVCVCVCSSLYIYIYIYIHTRIYILKTLVMSAGWNYENLKEKTGEPGYLFLPLWQ